MMSKYIDLVLCKHPNSNQNYLFQAPCWSYLKPFEDVIVDTRKGKCPAKVVNSITVLKGNEEFNFIVEMAGATLPLKKVLSRVVKVELKFTDDEEEHDGTDNNQE